MPDTDLSKLNIPAFSLPDPDIGLTDAAVEERRAAGLTGEGDTTGVRSVPQIVRAHTLTYFNLLNIFLGALVFSTGQYKHMLFLGIIICNSAIGIIQELRVRRQILKLSVITAARVRVRRGGREVEIPVPEIVQDDIVLLAPGDQIVADGPALRPAHLEVNEALLTGESKPVRKENGALLRSGSFVAAGTSLMRAEKVGRQCYAAGLAHKAQSRKRASSEMVRSIQRVFHIVSVALIPIGLMLYRSQRIAAAAAAQAGGMDAQWIYNNAIVRTVSGMIGMIPEGLVLLTSVSFIIGVGRLAMKGALVQEMQAIESLARADILCTDKTGTITSGELRVSKLMTIGNADKDRIRQICAHMGTREEFTATDDAELADQDLHLGDELNEAFRHQHDAEVLLVFRALRDDLREVINDAARNYDPAKVTKYAIDLATLYHKFYNACRIIGEEEGIMQARLSLSVAVKQVISNILDMLKITCPESM